MTINAFRKARKRLGLTQQQVASFAGVTQNTISELESGHNTNPTWDVLSGVARALESTPEALLPPRRTKKQERREAIQCRQVVA